MALDPSPDRHEHEHEFLRLTHYRTHVNDLAELTPAGRRYFEDGLRDLERFLENEARMDDASQ